LTTAIPRGENLTEISQALLSCVEQVFGARRNAEGKSLNELWAEQRTRLLALPADTVHGRRFLVWLCWAT
jgi:hypothetical protein